MFIQNRFKWSPTCSDTYVDQVQKRVLALMLMSPRWILLVGEVLVPSLHCDLACFFFFSSTECVCVRSGLCVLPCTTTQVAGSRDGCSPVSRYNSAEVELTVWTCAQLKEAWHDDKKRRKNWEKNLQLLLTAQCLSPCCVQNLLQVHLSGFVGLGSASRASGKTKKKETKKQIRAKIVFSFFLFEC